MNHSNNQSSSTFSPSALRKWPPAKWYQLDFRNPEKSSEIVYSSQAPRRGFLVRDAYEWITRTNDFLNLCSEWGILIPSPPQQWKGSLLQNAYALLDDLRLRGVRLRALDHDPDPRMLTDEAVREIFVQIKNILVWELTRTASNSRLPQVDLSTNTVCIGEQVYRLDRDEAVYVDVLIRTSDWESDSQTLEKMKSIDPALKSSRPDRIRNKLPKEIRDLIEAKPGAGTRFKP